MVYSELGRMPMIFKRKTRINKYWIKLLHTNNCILQHIYKGNLDRISCDNPICGPRGYMVLRIYYCL